MRKKWIDIPAVRPTKVTPYKLQSVTAVKLLTATADKILVRKLCRQLDVVVVEIWIQEKWFYDVRRNLRLNDVTLNKQHR